MTTFELAMAAPDDFPWVLGLLEACGLPKAGLGDHLDTLLVAHHKGVVVGSAALELYDGGALLRSVAVYPSERGTGLGRRLAQAALAMARENGVPSVYLLTETAEKFFASMGFERIERSDVPPDVKRSVEFTEACPESAIAMVLSLGSS